MHATKSARCSTCSPGRPAGGGWRELGTGAGVAAAWMVSALDPAVPFVTVEADPRLAGAAGGLFDADENVRVLAGDWREAMADEAPFDLLFVDAHGAKDDADAVLRLLAPRGTAVLDDFTVGWDGPDPRRDAWLRQSRRSRPSRS